MRDLKTTLVSAALAFDTKQSTKPGFNRWALPQYLEMIDEVCADVARGAEVRGAIVAGFSGRLAQTLLKAAGQSSYTRDDATSGGVLYQPVINP